MSKSIEKIREEVRAIKNETIAKANSATRVGGTMEDIVDNVEDFQESTQNIFDGFKETTAQISESVNADLDIADDKGKSIARFELGHIKTKNFDSSKDATINERGLMSAEDKQHLEERITEQERAKLNGIENGAQVNSAEVANNEKGNFDVCDENGNTIVRFSDGHIRTRSFDSSRINVEADVKVEEGDNDFSISDEEGNEALQIRSGYPITAKFNGATITQRIKDLEEGGGGGGTTPTETLPSYYFKDNYIDNLASEITNLVARGGAGSSAFFFFTDCHMSSNAKNTGKVIDYIARHTPIDRVIFGGDFVGAVEKKDAESAMAYSLSQAQEYLKMIGDISIDVYHARGNHDAWTCDDFGGATFKAGFNLNETTALLREPSDFIFNEKDSNGDYLYGYFDDKRAKIRYFVLDTSSAGNWGALGISQEQIRFIEGSVKSTPIGYDYIFVGHTLANPFMGSSSSDTRALLGAIYNKSTATVNTINVDFTSITGNLIVYVCGHHHTDCVASRGYMCIESNCDAIYNNALSRDILRQQGWLSDQHKQTKGTINEQTIKAIVINEAHSRIVVKHIGCGYDEYVNIGANNVNVGGTTELSSSLLNVTWHIYDCDGSMDTYATNHATINDNGVVSGIGAGFAMAIAIDENDNVEYFSIKVI